RLLGQAAGAQVIVNWRLCLESCNVRNGPMREEIMAKTLWLCLAFAALCAMPVAAQNNAPSARGVLQAADAAMGVSKLNSIQYSATGYVTALGQNYSSALDETWPRFELKSFVRTVDYSSNSMREDQVRVQGAW